MIQLLNQSDGLVLASTRITDGLAASTSAWAESCFHRCGDGLRKEELENSPGRCHQLDLSNFQALAVAYHRAPYDDAFGGKDAAPHTH